MAPDESISIPPFIAGIVGFVLGIVATSAWFIERDLRPHPPTEPENGTSTATTESSPAIVVVRDQRAGMSTTVDAMTVPASVWIAVADLRGKDVGNVLGARLVTGPVASATIPLLRGTVRGGTYAIVLYRDNGDGAFDLHADSLYVDFATGERVVATFRTN